MQNIVDTLKAEQQEAVGILRRVYPKSDGALFDSYAKELRTQMYKLGRWPTADEIRAQWGV